MMNILDKVKTGIFPIQGIGVNFFESITAQLVREEFKKGEIFVDEGEINEKLYYVESGLVRSYKKTSNKEITNLFTKEGDFFVSVSSFYTGVPSENSFQAIEDTVLLSMTKQLYFQILILEKEFALFSIQETFSYIREYQIQCNLLRMLNAEEKYNYFCEKFPHLIDRVSQKHIASFIGIDISYFSKISSKISKKNRS